VIGVLICRVRERKQGGTKLCERAAELSLQTLATIFGARKDHIGGRRTIFPRKRRHIIRAFVGPIPQKEGTQAAVRKPEKTDVLFLHAQSGEHPERLLLAQRAIRTVVLGAGMGNMLLPFYPFRITIPTGQEDDLDRAAVAEHAVNKAASSQRLVIRVRGKDHKVKRNSFSSQGCKTLPAILLGFAKQKGFFCCWASLRSFCQR